MYNEDEVTIIGIDPGTTLLGVSLMTINISDLRIVSTKAFTLNGNSLARETLYSEHYGDRHSRIESMCEYLMGLFLDLRPFAVSTEMPFFYRARPQAFEALMDVITALRNTLYRYDPLMKLNGVDPSSVKNAVGAKGNARKEEMTKAVLTLKDINFHSVHPIETLDEHCIDAIAVNYWFYKKFFLREI